MWPFRRRNDRLKEATVALATAHENLRRTKRRANEVHKVVNNLKGHNERNHFAEALEEIITGREGNSQ